MRVSIKFTLPLALGIFALFVVPRTARASTKDCPTEPVQNTPLADGQVITGTNCTLNTVGDVDSFVFTGTSGDTYQVATAIDGSAPTNLCMTIYNPSLVKIYSGCSSINFPNYQNSVVTDQTLTATGSYTVDITETSTTTMSYAVSLERLYPFPPNAQQAVLNKVAPGNIAELTDSNAFTFSAATTGNYEVSGTLPSGAGQNLCMTVYQPGGASLYAGCTSINFPNYQNTVEYSFVPPETGTYMAFMTLAGNDSTGTYSLEVSCLAGICPTTPPPSCTLTDTPSYVPGTLTMNFTVENTYATTWNIWVTYQNTMRLLYSAAQPVTDSPTSIVKTAPFPPEGKVGILSTLTTATKGIDCSSWVLLETGTPK